MLVFALVYYKQQKLTEMADIKKTAWIY